MKLLSATIDADATRPGPMEPRAREEARDRALAARLGVASMRDPRSAPMEGRSRADEDEVRAFELGWAASLLFNLVMLGAPLCLVVALPPVMECREREARFGFFAGETLSTCSTRGIGQRLKRLDDRIKMLVRGSGG